MFYVGATISFALSFRNAILARSMDIAVSKGFYVADTDRVNFEQVC
jgi:hypothetical protein